MWVVFFNGTGRVSQSVSQSYTQREACTSKKKQLSGLVATWDYPGDGRFFRRSKKRLKKRMGLKVNIFFSHYPVFRLFLLHFR